MTYTIELLDMVKARYNLTSDYQLAKKLNVTGARVSNWRCKKNSMDWDIAFAIADLLELEDHKVVHNLLEDKYENPRLVNALRVISPN
ncbi:transcriptional regulator [Photobacterium indicum]|uniref:Transcriptional regulator n=1 Tax=Photobacterium indicum TaxID=81447 RepID=A0A2T3L8J1_9GAMM|nr:transcriptional regulator [Photobacterium indicum]PSV47292.1 transcriptional regulator [Photobacterium indicum]